MGKLKKEMMAAAKEILAQETEELLWSYNHKKKCYEATYTFLDNSSKRREFNYHGLKVMSIPEEDGSGVRVVVRLKDDLTLLQDEDAKKLLKSLQNEYEWLYLDINHTYGYEIAGKVFDKSFKLDIDYLRMRAQNEKEKANQ